MFHHALTTTVQKACSIHFHGHTKGGVNFTTANGLRRQKKASCWFLGTVSLEYNSCLQD